MALKKIHALSGIQSRFGELFALLPFTPNQITVSAVLFAAAGFLLAYYSQPIPSLAFFLLSGLLDALDGAVARARKMVTAAGAYMDGITDRLVEFLLIMSFFFYPLPPFFLPVQVLLILVLFFGSAMSSFATAYAEHRHVAGKVKIGRQPGVLPRPERLLLLFAALALVPFDAVASSAVLFVCAALCIITFAQRFFYFSS